MAFYFVTGKLGNGKTLIAVSKMAEKLRAGLPVASNVDIDLQFLLGKKDSTARYIRIPDKPTIHDLDAIGIGNSTYDESKNGLLVLDECGTWFNSRNWQDKSRSAVNNWMLHARKLGWDVLLLVQDISIVDAQAREALSEFTAFCRRLDNLRVPLIGGLYKFVFGTRLKLPKVHTARVVYGAAINDPLSDRWTYRGTDLYQAYDTKQMFSSEYPHGTHSVLPPFYINRRTMAVRNLEFYMRLTRIYFRRVRVPVSMVAGIAAGLVMSYVMTRYANDQFYTEYQLLMESMQKLEQVQTKRKLGAYQPAEQIIPDEPFQLVEGMKIVGYASYSNHVTYDLSKTVTEDEKAEVQVISTDDLSSIYQIEPNGPCHVRLAVSGAHRDVFCF